MTRFLILILLLPNLSVAVAQQEEFKPGLIGDYQAGEYSAARVDPDIAFNWGTSAPHPAIPAEGWSVTWSGLLLVRTVTPYQFSSQVNGQLSVEVGGQVVLKGDTAESTWITGDLLPLEPGFQELTVRFSPSASGAEVKLFWSNETFATEPIPTHQLFHTVDDQQIQLIELGRQIVNAKGCRNCHRVDQHADRASTAPAMWGVTSGMNPDWIVAKLQGRNPEAETDHMPVFGFSKSEAEEIAAYLHRLEAPFDLISSSASKPKKGEPTGQELFHSIGCLACHQVDELGTTSILSGPPLTNIGNKRSADWIVTWLSSPERIFPQHRMPTFPLTRSERGRIADYLSSLGRKEQTQFGRSHASFTTDMTDRGQALVKKFQCANCHKIPAIDLSLTTPVAPLRRVPNKLENSCLSTQPDRSKRRPFYPHLNREAVLAYLKSLNEKLPSLPSEFELGQRVIEHSQCLACHSRGSQAGLKAIANDITRATPSLKNQSPLVIPPSLNAVGDKLRDDVLEKAIAGRQERVRANWLTVRMPRFPHSPEEVAALKHYLIEHDRLPAAAATSHAELAVDDQELLLLGRKLIGAGGWSCIACHQIGDYVPKNTAIGTRGSDLMAIGDRLRPEFYYRWTRAPIRIIPGMEMPSFTKPVPGMLENDVHAQLTAVWRAVNNDRFEPPKNPSQVEQLWQVAEGDAPRIVRDVFLLDNDQSVARALAVGFGNQHGLLLDLDTMAVRDWRYGDFASQRTIGKSWYWEMAGASLISGLTNDSPFRLQRSSTAAPLPIVGADADRVAHLKSYQVQEQTVRLTYELRIVVDGSTHTVPVTEVLRPATVDSRTGWMREVAIQQVSDDWSLVMLAPAFDELKFASRLSREEESRSEGVLSTQIVFLSNAQATRIPLPEVPPTLPSSDPVTTLPGYRGKRLPLPAAIMPTALTKDRQGQLLFTSLKGHLYRATDSDGDGLEDRLQMLEEGLSAAFGVLADGNEILVSHKPELLRLIDADDDGVYERREVVADGWGHTDNYHDWVTGPVLDSNGNLHVATGSDYAQPKRDRNRAQWRGHVVQVGTDGTVASMANELRYPIGIASDAQGRLFVSDQQGVQNTFNEINHIVPGGAYGVPGQLDGNGASQPRRATIQIPHPWTRSVNGIFFLPETIDSPFAGHGIGCEYNSKFLIRFTYHDVDGELQGACYHFSQPTWEQESNTFLGPIGGFADEEGHIYIGSIFDSGWLGGPNTGEIVKLSPHGDYGNGIREIRAVPEGFEIEFLKTVDPDKATQLANYSLSGYTRVFQGSYASDDTGRYSPDIHSLTLSEDHKQVTLQISNLKPEFVYEFNIGDIDAAGESMFPTFGAYTLNRIPRSD